MEFRESVPRCAYSKKAMLKRAARPATPEAPHPADHEVRYGTQDLCDLDLLATTLTG
jgi:hypothetical protein